MKKVFIARGRGGWCHIYENRPLTYDCGVWYVSVGGKCKEFDTETANILGIPFPNPGEMIEWPPPAQTAASEPEPPQSEKKCGTCKWDCAAPSTEKYVHCGTCCAFSNWEPREISETDKNADKCKPEPEPPAENLVPITSISQLKVGDRVRTATAERTVLGILDCIVALSYGRYTDRFGAWWTLEEINNAKLEQVVTAQRTLSREEAREAIHDGKTVRRVGSGFEYRLSDDKRIFEIILNGKAFDIPEGRYEIVKRGE